MTYWKIYSRARSTRVALEGFLGGATAFLVGGSPRLLQLDLRLLKLPGMFTLAINNAATIFRPNAFIAIDTARCFNPNIFLDPTVMKFFPYSRHDEIVGERKLSHFPNTYFFDSQEDVMMTEFCRLEGPLPFWRSTFFTALAMLYQFGCRRVNLIGCTFDRGYAHGEGLSDAEQAENDRAYQKSIEYMKELMPRLKDEGMEVRTCHENTALEGIVDFVSIYDAVSEASLAATSIPIGKLEHKSKFEPG